MRHGDKQNNLGRKKGHRDALLKNMSISLLEHKRISTTLAKAKALRVFVEPLITKSKENTTHSRRLAFSKLQNKESIKELFDVIALKVGDRPGGYTRIVKTGFRLGDGAETAIIELVDFNEVMLTAKAEKAATVTTRKTRRSRGGKKTTDTATATPVVTSPSVKENNPSS